MATIDRTNKGDLAPKGASEMGNRYGGGDLPTAKPTSNEGQYGMTRTEPTLPDATVHRDSHSEMVKVNQ